MVDDTTKLLLGPVLALIPILVWELAIKPGRARRNIALLMLSEVELSLEEIAYYLACREQDAETYLANMLLPRGSFMAVQTSLGELPPGDVRDLIRFYALTARIEVAHVGLAAASYRASQSATPGDRSQHSEAVVMGQRGLSALLQEAWDLGAETRESLDELVRTGWMDAPPVMRDADAIRADARTRCAARR